MAAPTAAGQALVDSFQSIRVINMAHRADRRREMAAQFARLGLSFDHPAIDWFTARRFTEAAGFPTIGTRGCFDSHLSLLREAAEKGIESLLILEDDCDFHDEIETLLPAALDVLGQSDWQIFHGSLLPGHHECSERPVELVAPDATLRGTHFLAFRGPVIEQAVLYLDAMARRAPGEAHPDGVPMHYDGALCVFRKRNRDVRTYVANPDLGHQRLSRTDIHDVRFYDRLPVLRSVTALLRQAVRLTGRTRQMGKK